MADGGKSRGGELSEQALDGVTGGGDGNSGASSGPMGQYVCPACAWAYPPGIPYPRMVYCRKCGTRMNWIQASEE